MSCIWGKLRHMGWASQGVGGSASPSACLIVGLLLGVPRAGLASLLGSLSGGRFRAGHWGGEGDSVQGSSCRTGSLSHQIQGGLRALHRLILWLGGPGPSQHSSRKNGQSGPARSQAGSGCASLGGHGSPVEVGDATWPSWGPRLTRAEEVVVWDCGKSGSPGAVGTPRSPKIWERPLKRRPEGRVGRIL